MTPRFALDLDHDGIRLSQRAGDGWEPMGGVALDDPDLAEKLSQLRDDALEAADGALATELVIPPSQILYTSIPWKRGALLTERTIRPALAGLTPCDPDELVFDWEADGNSLRLAILEKVTLDEAEEFAEGYGFAPITFSARPGIDEFPRDPDFGATSVADRVLAELATPARPDIPDLAPDTPAPVKAPESDTALLARALAGPSHDRPGKTVTGGARPPIRLGSGGGEIMAVLTPGRIAAGAGLLAVAVLVWLTYFSVRGDGPSDPAAALSDVPPSVAADTPALAAPDTGASTPPVSVAEAPPAPNPAPALTPALPLGDPPSANAEPPEAFTGDNPRLRYAVTGIWPEGPPPMTAPAPEMSEEFYLTSIDPVTLGTDAVALILPRDALAEPRPPVPLSPPPAGTTFDVDAETGFVRATPEGAVTPDGIEVTSGPPPLEPPPRPASVASRAPTVVAVAGPELPDTRPRTRPTGFADRIERAQLGGRTLTELAGLRPAPRPVSAQSEALAGVSEAPTEYAVATAPPPRTRPADFASRLATNRAVAAALAATAPEPEPQQPARSAAPSIPTSASVARQATLENAIRLRELNLIGVYGKDGDRRALVRLPSGRYVKVEVGDRLDGGRIAAISRDALRYVKSGRNITLTVPSG